MIRHGLAALATSALVVVAGPAAAEQPAREAPATARGADEAVQPPYRGGGRRARRQAAPRVSTPRWGFAVFGGASAFLPDGDLWADNEYDFGTDNGDLASGRFGVDFHYAVNPRVEILAGFEGGGTDFVTSYIDYVFEDGDEIAHYTEYTFLDFTLGLRLRLLPAGDGFSPYVFGGAMGSFYDYRESGDFVDFGSVHQDIVYDAYQESSFLPGFFAGAGAEFAVSPNVGFFAEWRLHRAEGAHQDDFAGYGDFAALRNGGVVGVRLQF